MKITDKELMDQIWKNQLRLVSRKVLNRYCGDGRFWNPPYRYGVCDDKEFWFYAASDEHRISRERITKVIGKKQLLVRIKKLIEEGKVYSVYGQPILTFCIDSSVARKAFKDARKFWLDKGVPTGITNGSCNCKEVPELEKWIEECQSMLMSKYENER